MYQKTNELAGGHEFATAQDMLNWLEKAMTDNIWNNKDRQRFEADPYAYTVNFAQAAGLALDDYIKQRKAGIDTPVFNRSVLNHTFGIVWWGEGQTTDSSVPATPVEDTIEK